MGKEWLHEMCGEASVGLMDAASELGFKLGG